MNDFLPITKKEVTKRGWKQLDVILFTGDAYVDHPAFGSAVIGRLVESLGYKIAIIPQPNWRDDLRDFKKLGEPRLFFAVTAGNMDSMVNHYTANKRLRSNDAYTPDGRSGFRPDYPTIVYSNILKKLYPNSPVIIGGIEASLRRCTHYDYWQDKLKPSILVDSKADLLVYGMGEKVLEEVLQLSDKGIPINELQTLAQTCFISDTIPNSNKWKDIHLHKHEKCLSDKNAFADNFTVIEKESNRMNPSRLIQEVGNKKLIINPSHSLPTEKELDRIYDLGYTRLPHPKYKNKGVIPAYEMIKHSINIHRGCFGGCSFCTISMHQGKFISSRSFGSILREVEAVKKMSDFKGYLTDLGGPSANMYCMKGKDLSTCNQCTRPSCIYPSICKNLDTNHQKLLSLYQEVRKTAGIKKVFIGSGVRYDMFINSSQSQSPDHKKYMQELIKHHVSGRLKVAPEHTEEDILSLVRKPSFQLFEKFKKEFEQVNQAAGLNQQLIPYFISSLPGSTNKSMVQLALKTKKLGYRLEQIQDFTPTPMTRSTVTYYLGFDPYTKQKVFTAKNQEAKKFQRQIFFWYKPENRRMFEKELKKLKTK